jgi:hypothetical protein
MKTARRMVVLRAGNAKSRWASSAPAALSCEREAIPLDGLADRIKDPADLRTKEDKGDDRDDRDEREDQSVFGQTLTFLVTSDGRDE